METCEIVFEKEDAKYIKEFLLGPPCSNCALEYLGWESHNHEEEQLKKAKELAKKYFKVK